MATRSRALVAALALVLATRVSRAEGPAPPRLLWTFGAQTRPIGLLARADLASSRGALALGAHAAFKSVSLEFGAGPAVYALGGLLTFTLRATVEPGVYLTMPPGASLAQGRAREDPADRTAGLRYGGSALLGLNLRVGRFWLYHRATAWARTRLEPEYDRIADAVVDDELGAELATALMVDLAPRGRRRVWLYAEHTHGWIAGVGTVWARPSVGVIVEELLPRVAVDVDLNYGLREGPLAGFGVILALWIAGE